MSKGYAIDLLLENATSFREKAEIHALTENEVKQINNSMITNLYKSAMDKGYINYDEIPDSKGDITKFSGYDNLLGSLNLLKELSAKSKIKVKEIDTVETSIMNIRTYKNQFERAFALNHGFIVMQYNSLVYACLESTSQLISSYVDFVKRVDRTEFVMVRGKGNAGNLCIKNLEQFNDSVKKGEFNKVLQHLLQSNKENFIGSTTVSGVVAIGLITASIVPIMRELVYYFYHSRMVVSEYLNHQAMFLEMNKVNIESSNLPAKERNMIIKKQAEYIKNLNKISEKIKVNGVITNKTANEELRKENKEWTLDNIKQDESNSGFALL